MPSTMQ